MSKEKAEQYRERARICEAEADKLGNENAKSPWEQAARTWLSLAEQTERADARESASLEEQATQQSKSQDSAD